MLIFLTAMALSPPVTRQTAQRGRKLIRHTPRCRLVGSHGLGERRPDLSELSRSLNPAAVWCSRRRMQASAGMLNESNARAAFSTEIKGVPFFGTAVFDRAAVFTIGVQRTQ